MKDIKLETPQDVVQFMNELGFRETKITGVFYHLETGEDFFYDISATGKQAWQIQRVIIDRLIEYGRNEKLKEIQTALGFTL